MIRVEKKTTISDLNVDNNIILNKQLQNFLLIYTEEKCGFFNKKYKIDCHTINKILKELLLNLLKENQIYYYAKGLYFNYNDLNNVITSKESFLKSDSLLCFILNSDDINKAVAIWENGCTENRTFIITKKGLKTNNLKDLCEIASVIVTTTFDCFGYGFSLVYNNENNSEKKILSIMGKSNIKFSK